MFFRNLHSRTRFGTQPQFVHDVFVAGGCSYFQTPNPGSDSYEKKIFQGSPITPAITSCFPTPIDIEGVSRYFCSILKFEKIRPFLDRFGFPTDIEEDVEFFCTALAHQFALFIEKAPNDADDIVLVEYQKLLYNPTRAVTITKTLRKSYDFDGIFISVPHTGAATTTNPCLLNLFHLNHANSRFSFNSMESFLVENIVSYVQDRMTIDQHERSGPVGALWAKALGTFQKAKDIDPTWLDNELGNILIYAFLEQVLGAPKLFNKIELFASGHGDVALAGGGIHFLNTDGDNPATQLVFGKSNITNDIQTAIDNAIDAVKSVVAGMKTELFLIDNPILSAKFPATTAKQLSDILIPKKFETEKSFGLFLGYSLSLPGVSTADFPAILTARMQADIVAHAKYISDKITAEGLDNYAFYFYFLPFNNADAEKKSIMKNILQGGS